MTFNPEATKLPSVSSEEEFYARLGSRIAEERKLANLTQQGLADAIGLSRTSVTNIENGRQPLQVYTLLKIAVHLKVSINGLLPHEGTVSIPDNLDASVRAWLENIVGEKS